MTIHNVNLSDEVERGAVGGPSFLTSVIEMVSGQEQRNLEWSRAKLRWRIGYGIDGKSFYSEILEFFYARRGRGYGFLFKDWSDFEAVDQALGTGTSTTGSDGNADFQIIRTYTDAGSSYTRKITRPRAATITVEVNGTPSANWTLQTGGIIRFNDGSRPLTGQVVTASYEFDVPVRFDRDTLDLQLEWEDAGAVREIEIVELLE